MARRYLPIRISETGYEAIKTMAETEDRTVSDMARILLSEAVQARAATRHNQRKR